MENQCGIVNLPCHFMWLVSKLLDFYMWFWERLVATLLWLAEGLVNGIIALISLIPVPEFVNFITFGSLPPGVLYFMEVLKFQEGFAIYLSAMIIRFVMRRIPFIN